MFKKSAGRVQSSPQRRHRRDKFVSVGVFHALAVDPVNLAGTNTFNLTRLQGADKHLKLRARHMLERGRTRCAFALFRRPLLSSGSCFRSTAILVARHPKTTEARLQFAPRGNTVLVNGPVRELTRF